MTDLPGIQPAFSGTSANISAGKVPKATLSSDFETFLKMLTVQMQNQDPLNPIDSAEYAVQLATFSAVEQQVQTNDLLRQMLGQSGAGLSQLASWVGMEVRVPGAARYDGAPIAVWAEPATGSSTAFLVARDASGTEINRRQIPTAAGEIAWSGDLGLGQTAMHGSYSFEIESYVGDTIYDVRGAQTYAEVAEARSTPTGTELVTTGGQAVLADYVSAIRMP